jgi:hypothetical protein
MGHIAPAAFDTTCAAYTEVFRALRRVMAVIAIKGTKQLRIWQLKQSQSMHP